MGWNAELGELIDADAKVFNSGCLSVVITQGVGEGDQLANATRHSCGRPSLINSNFEVLLVKNVVFNRTEKFERPQRRVVRIVLRSSQKSGAAHFNCPVESVPYAVDFAAPRIAPTFEKILE
jgi:hypothetical protein